MTLLWAPSHKTQVMITRKVCSHQSTTWNSQQHRMDTALRRKIRLTQKSVLRLQACVHAYNTCTIWQP